jgi:threonine/homoserine/homoserine lactone efflux protein
MFVSNLVSGLLIGFPIMLAVGPIAILLVDQGLERGTRSALPAALGVASADLSFSAIAAVGGTSIAVFLTPITPVLSMAAVALLLFLAVRLFRTATAELRVLRAVPAASAPGGASGEPCFAGVGDISAFTAEYPAIDRSDRTGDLVQPSAPGSASLLDTEPGTADIPFGHLRGTRLGGAFFGLTVVNPLTVVLFAAVVVAGGAGAGTPGWAIGMGLSSLVVHGGWVLLGGALGSTLGEVATARMRLGASVLMAALALHFLLA